MVDEHVVLGETAKMSAPPASRGGVTGVHGAGAQVGALPVGEGPQPAKVDGDIEQVDAVLGNIDLGDQHLQEIGGDGGRRLEAYRLAEPPPVQLELDGGQQVFGLVLLHRQVGVAGEPEGVVLGDGHRREDACPGGRR